MGSSSRTTSDSEDLAAVLIRTLDSSAVASLALATCRDTQSLRGDPDLTVTCVVPDPPEKGSYNIVYRARFSDGLSWAVRVGYNPWSPSRARQMKLDMIALQYIMDHTSLPIPRVHAFDCDVENDLRHPYMIMDFVHGTRLVDVWNEPSWWDGERSKERLLTSIAGYMVELSKLEFNSIGALDRPQPDQPYEIVPFSRQDDFAPSDGVYGPYDSTHTYLLELLDAQIGEERPSPPHALFRLLLGGLLDTRYDGPPFTLAHPDFDSQNIFLDDAGNVTAFIDWDGVRTEPRRLGALSYPAWLDVDWDPLMYGGYKQDPNHDTPEDLHRYREIYTRGIDKHSDGTLGAVVRNSHVLSSLAVAIFFPPSLHAIVYNVGAYVFGSQATTFSVLEGIQHSSWYKQSPDEVASLAGTCPALIIRVAVQTDSLFHLYQKLQRTRAPVNPPTTGMPTPSRKRLTSR